MKVTNILDIDTWGGLYSWFLENHDREREFWIRVNRARNPYPGVIGCAGTMTC